MLRKHTPWTAAVLTLLIAGPALANNKVDYVDIRAAGIYPNDGVIKVKPVNGKFQSTETDTVSYHVEMKAGCKGAWAVGSVDAVFDNVTACEGKICEGSPNAYSVSVGAGQNEIPYRKAEMKVPVSQLGVDPVAMCQDLLNKNIKQGGNALQFFNSEHTIIPNMTISAIARCEKPGKDSFYDTDHLQTKLRIICNAQTMPNSNTIQAKKPVTAVPVGGNTIGGGYQPLVINDAFLTTDKLHYNGECPANLKFDINLSGSGKGQVKLHLVEYGKNAYTSAPIAFDGTNAWKKQSFTYNLNPGKDAIGNKVERSFRVFLEIRDQKGNTFEWSKNGEYKKLDWSHTCKAKTSVPAMGSKLNAQPGSNPSPTPVTPNQVKAPAKTNPVVPGDIKAPTTPKPAPSNIKAPVTPTPAPGTIKSSAEPKPALGGGLGRDLIRRANDEEPTSQP